MDWAGRRWGNILMAIPATAGWILLAMAGPLNMNNPWTFYMGRTLTGKTKKSLKKRPNKNSSNIKKSDIDTNFIGVGCGGFILGSTIYIVEISEPQIRGALNTFMQTMLCLGILFCNGVGALIEWDLLSGLCMIFPSKRKNKCQKLP